MAKSRADMDNQDSRSSTAKLQNEHLFALFRQRKKILGGHPECTPLRACTRSRHVAMYPPSRRRRRRTAARPTQLPPGEAERTTGIAGAESSLPLVGSTRLCSFEPCCSGRFFFRLNLGCVTSSDQFDPSAGPASSITSLSAALLIALEQVTIIHYM